MIFPDLRTLYNTIPQTKLEEKNLTLLSSLDSPARKDSNWRQIKNGLTQTVISTHSEIFQPFTSLKKIILYDPEKWYYNSQQDPRYNTKIVVQKMAEIYGVKLVYK